MQMDYKGSKVRLPDFLIVGAAKCGTTSLYYFLSHHPKVFMPDIKEPWFFTYMNTSPLEYKVRTAEIIREPSEYFSLFEAAGRDQLLGEASTTYLYAYEETIRNIKEVYGEDSRKIKIIIILRSPPARTFSHYMMHRREKLEPLEFREAISPETIRERIESKSHHMSFDYLGFGNYYEQVKAYLREFDDVRVLLYDDLSSDYQSFARDVFSFLGIEEIEPQANIRYNVSGTPRVKALNSLLASQTVKRVVKSLVPLKTARAMKHKINAVNMKKVEMKGEDRTFLSSYFREGVERLGELIGRDLSGWL